MKNSSGTVVAVALLRGIGTAPLARFLPGRITTFSGNGNDAYVDNGSPANASFSNPQGLAVDAQGNVYVADSTNQVVRKIASGTGAVSTFAGNGTAGRSGDQGLATQASLNTPTGVAADAAGNLYIADQGNSLIRRVDAVTGIITTVAGGGAGTGGVDVLGDGLAATNAVLSGCSNVIVDTVGNLYIADSFDNAVRKVSASTGTISLFAGRGSSAGSDGYGNGAGATSIALNNPNGLALDAAGNLYIADTGHSMIRMVNATSNVVSDVAGNGSYGFSSDGTIATRAALGSPMGVAVDAAGDIYIADIEYNVVRYVNAASGLIATVGGNGTGAYAGDGGFATLASLNAPMAVAFDNSGNLLIADYSNYVIRTVSFSPPSLGFPSTTVGAASAAASVSLVNLGNAALSVSSLSFSSGFQQKLTGTSDCTSSTSLAAAGPCQLTMTFSPTAAGAVSGSLTISDNQLNSGSSTQTLTLSGTGLGGTTAITVSKASLTFASQVVGTASAAQSFLATSSGTAALNISSIQLAGSNPTDFTITTTCGATLAASSSCSVSVAFVPQVAGTRTATVMIYDSANTSPQSVSLTGTGTGGPLLSVSSASLAFGSQVLTTASSVQNVTLTNSGSGPMNVNGIILAGANVADFQISTETCGGILAASTSCIIGLDFMPGALGGRSANLAIAISPGVSPQTVSLSGTGIMPTLSVTPSVPFFGSPTVGHPSSPVGLVLANPVAASLTISSITLSGTNVADFSITANTCSGVLNANSCSLTLVFTPQTTGTRSATLTITTNGATPTLTMPLSGTAAVAAPRLVTNNKKIDYDGDGKADYAIWRPGSGSWYIVPSSNPTTYLFQQLGLPGDVPVAGDYDGDGKTDFAVWRPANGTWYVILSSNPSVPVARQLGLQTDEPQLGDFDGDGKMDYAVWRPSNGTWYINLSTNPTALVGRQWGLNGDIPVPGDYDGDGKTDYAVWRPSNGTWYVNPSSNPSTLIATQWGLSADMPVPSDYDGDGKTDFVVWRPSNGTWYVIPSRTPGAPVIKQWGLTGDIPQ